MEQKTKYVDFTSNEAFDFMYAVNSALNEKYLNGTLKNGEQEFSESVIKIMTHTLTEEEYRSYLKLSRAYFKREDVHLRTTALWMTKEKEAKPAVKES